MKARIVVFLVMLVTLASVSVSSAQACEEPISAVTSFYAALDAGDSEAAVAMFTPDAVATLARGETYQGPEEILDMVELLAHPERYHAIVQADTVGDTVTVVVDIYDNGIRWGEEKIAIEMQGGKLHTFHEQVFRLRLS